jgi:hypothetical protein
VAKLTLKLKQNCNVFVLGFAWAVSAEPSGEFTLADNVTEVSRHHFACVISAVTVFGGL